MHSIVRQKLTIGLKKKYSSLHHYRVVTVADTEGEQGAIPPPPRSPRPNFAVAKVCRIQGWKTRFKKYLVFSFLSFYFKKLKFVKI